MAEVRSSIRVGYTGPLPKITEGSCSPLLLQLSELVFLLLFGASLVMYVTHAVRNASLLPQYAHFVR